MTDEEERRALDARIQAEVDRAVAPYQGVAPPVMLRKMRELAERYFREHPQASRILEMQVQKQRLRSGERVKAPEGGEADTDTDTGDAAKEG